MYLQGRFRRVPLLYDLILFLLKVWCDSYVCSKSWCYQLSLNSVVPSTATLMGHAVHHSLLQHSKLTCYSNLNSSLLSSHPFSSLYFSFVFLFSLRSILFSFHMFSSSLLRCPFIVFLSLLVLSILLFSLLCCSLLFLFILFPFHIIPSFSLLSFPRSAFYCLFSYSSLLISSLLVLPLLLLFLLIFFFFTSVLFCFMLFSFYFLSHVLFFISFSLPPIFFFFFLYLHCLKTSKLMNSSLEH